MSIAQDAQRKNEDAMTQPDYSAEDDMMRTCKHEQTFILHKQTGPHNDSDACCYYQQACYDILAALDAMAGKKVKR